MTTIWPYSNRSDLYNEEQLLPMWHLSLLLQDDCSQESDLWVAAVRLDSSGSAVAGAARVPISCP